LQIITPARRTIILEGENVQLERQRRNNSNANKAQARIFTRKALPLPPIFIFKTLQINSTPEKETGPKKYRIPASLLGKSWFHAKP
jgi:hypothetical protein